jgi:hypothetical protein
MFVTIPAAAKYLPFLKIGILEYTPREPKA